MFNSEIKICQNCKNQFTIEPEDFVFYEKIQVPSPTFCPECRMVRRMAWRNERAFYKRKCDLCQKDIISVYSSQFPKKVYCSNCWNGDKWDAIDYGQNIDFSESFFKQFKNFQKQVPRLALVNIKSVNSDYQNYSSENKNCYMIVSAIWDEDCYYGYRIFSSKDCFDCYDIDKCELCYECSECTRSYASFHCTLSENLVNCLFCFDCKNCQNCFGCVGLRNKSYYWFNKPLSKEEYNNKLKEFQGYNARLKVVYQNFLEILYQKPQRANINIGSRNCSGYNISHSKNCLNCFSAREVEDSKNIFRCSRSKDVFDSIFVDNTELSYETMSVEQDYNFLFGVQCWYSRNISYSDLCLNSSNLFACIGLRNKQYCIFNKQYTKEEYEELVPKIIKHMNDMPYISRKSQILNPKLQINSNNQNSKSQTREIIYRYGEFFPLELSPFAYNETIAQEYFPLTKEQAIDKGYQWKDPETKNYQITLKTEQIPDHINDVNDDILDQIIQCKHYDIDSKQTLCNEQCSTAFKIIPRELEFYRKNNLPLPRLCPNCRHYQRIKQRNPLKLWHRQCQCAGTQSDNKVYQNTIQHFHSNEHCPNEFETTYSPDRKEIVYCEKCYQQEVV